ncbi:ATP-dependent sacrificial sulfur transferase LarE [Maridesulfovibrio ferrireducens]|nr:ATP-dependent sacrificial sulfur transferase LarE [Maridesulfovibrio ferrireducens]
MTNSHIIQKQYKDLLKIFKLHERAFVAFSGGIDSSLVAKAAFDALGDKAFAITIDSELTANRDISFACRSAASIGINHQVIKISVLKNSLISDNTKSRCYYCKKAIIDTINRCPLFDGSHADDPVDRAGLKAIREASVISPLALTGFTKKNIIEAAGFLQLLSLNRPSNSCLATRIETGIPLTAKKIFMVERTEECMFEAGARWCRARTDGNKFQIEYGSDSPLDEFNIKAKLTTLLPQVSQKNIQFIIKT